MKLNIKFPIVNLLILTATYFLFFIFFTYLKLNNQNITVIDQSLLNKDYSLEFKTFIEIFKMPEIYYSSIVILLFLISIFIATFIASQFKLKYLTVSILSVSLLSFSFLSYKNYEIEKYVDDSIPLISDLLKNEVIYERNKFESAFFKNTKFYIEEYQKNPTTENKMKYSMSLYFIPDKLSFFNSLNNENVSKYQEIMKLNLENQLNYKKFTNFSILYLFLILSFNIFILFKNRKIK